MARIFITGSSTGLGLMTGQVLVRQGHRVVLHARNDTRAADAQSTLPEAEAILRGDIETVAGARDVAAQANALGTFDAVIHNAGVGGSGSRRMTADGLPVVFAVNTLAAYLLTVLMERPKRLVYLSSGMHRHARAQLDGLAWRDGQWSGSPSYSQTKLYDTMLAFAVARLWPGVASNAVDPGWVPTRMGGPGAPDDLEEGGRTQAWLAASDEAEARTTGELYHHMRPASANPEARDTALQDRLLAFCGAVGGAPMP